MSPRNPALLSSLVLVLTASSALAQVYVYPRRAEKSQVKNFRFNWEHVDILVGPLADKKEAEGFERRLHPENMPAPGEASPVQPEPHGGTPAEGSASIGTGKDTLTPSMVPHAPGKDEPGPRAHGSGDAPRASATGDKDLLSERQGGVRLYFYDREREVAERAVGFIVASYRRLVKDFDYVPTKTFPYVLYNSYQEFLQTNLFPLSEGTLGVTGVQDLKLTLPYFGDHRLFEDVSSHEMAHQFTIQKVRTMTEQSGRQGEALEGVPLWFIEGLAEYYAKDGMDPDADMMVRDFLINPRPEKGYAFVDFFQEGPYSFLHIYKLGQARVTFLEETYGKGIIQKVLENVPLMIRPTGGLGLIRNPFQFPQLLELLTKDDPGTISRRFESWMKRRYFPSYLAATQEAAMVKMVPGDVGIVTAMNASPDGNLLAVRTIDPTTFDSELQVFDRRAPDKKLRVVKDNAPGAESLHPTEGRNFDLTSDAVAYVAEVNARDRIHWVELRHRAVERPEEPQVYRPASLGPQVSREIQQSYAQPREKNPVGGEGNWNIELRSGDGVEFALADHGLIGAFSPTFSPDGKRLAFIGLNNNGIRDVYVLDREGATFKLSQVTNDVYAERQASWGPDGIVFNSDATAHGKYNLFRVRAEAPSQVEQLTTEARDHLDVDYLQDGRILFVAYDKGRANIHEFVGGQVIRRTDIATGLFDVAAGPDGALWALLHHGGERRPGLLPRAALLSAEAIPQTPIGPPRELPRTELANAQRYRPFAPENIDVGPIFGFAGGSSGGIAGQLFATASDRLKDHTLVLNAAAYGSLELTEAFLLYFNQQSRTNWGGGLFQAVNFRVDQTFADNQLFFTSAERFLGGLVSARYPFDRFTYVQGDVAIGGVSYFLQPSVALALATNTVNGTSGSLLEPWLERNRGMRFQTEASLRLGYDTIRYHPLGPVAGLSLLLELTGIAQPFDRNFFGNTRFDGEYYFPLDGRLHVMLRGGAGSSTRGSLSRQFYLSSWDTIRGIEFGDVSRLVGRNYFFTTAELQVPLNQLVRIVIFSDIVGIAGVDFGSVANFYTTQIAGPGVDPRDMGLWDRRVLNGVVGVNFALGPILFRLHFAKPLDIDAPAGTPNGGDWVTNFSIALAGYPMYFGSQGKHARWSSFGLMR